MSIDDSKWTKSFAQHVKDSDQTSAPPKPGVSADVSQEPIRPREWWIKAYTRRWPHILNGEPTEDEIQRAYLTDSEPMIKVIEYAHYLAVVKERDTIQFWVERDALDKQLSRNIPGHHLDLIQKLKDSQQELIKERNALAAQLAEANGRISDSRLYAQDRDAAAKEYHARIAKLESQLAVELAASDIARTFDKISMIQTFPSAKGLVVRIERLERALAEARGWISEGITSAVQGEDVIARIERLERGE